MDDEKDIECVADETDNNQVREDTDQTDEDQARVDNDQTDANQATEVNAGTIEMLSGAFNLVVSRG